MALQGILQSEQEVYWPEQEEFDFEFDRWTVPDFFDVLVVEDDVTTTRLIKAIARRSNSLTRIKSFPTAELAIDHLSILKERNFTAPDLAIVDVYLKGKLDGFAVAEQLETLFPETTVAVTSSMHPRLFQERARRLACPPLYIQKPFTIQEVAGLFKRLN